MIWPIVGIVVLASLIFGPKHPKPMQAVFAPPGFEQRQPAQTPPVIMEEVRRP